MRRSYVLPGQRPSRRTDWLAMYHPVAAPIRFLGGCALVLSFLPHRGAVAQLVARLVRNEKARGSNPLSSTRREPRPTSVNVAGRAGFRRCHWFADLGSDSRTPVYPSVAWRYQTVGTSSAAVGGECCRGGRRGSGTGVRGRPCRFEAHDPSMPARCLRRLGGCVNCAPGSTRPCWFWPTHLPGLEPARRARPAVLWALQVEPVTHGGLETVTERVRSYAPQRGGRWATKRARTRNWDQHVVGGLPTLSDGPEDLRGVARSPCDQEPVQLTSRSQRPPRRAGPSDEQGGFSRGLLAGRASGRRRMYAGRSARHRPVFGILGTTASGDMQSDSWAPVPTLTSGRRPVTCLSWEAAVLVASARVSGSARRRGPAASARRPYSRRGPGRAGRPAW